MNEKIMVKKKRVFRRFCFTGNFFKFSKKNYYFNNEIRKCIWHKIMDLWYDSKTEPVAVKSTLTGISYFGSLCSNYKYLIVEDDGQLSNKFTLARQILHSMGVNYDTDSCGNDHLMNKFLTQNNPILSSCSKQQIKMNFLDNGETLSEMAGCLSYSLETEQNMFGQFWNANEQCKLIFGPSASFCHEYSSQICSALYCRQSVSSKTCMAYSPAANGTVCGFRKERKKFIENITLKF
ncbi:A disintegrin and metallo ase with thrombospondin motifs 17 isoform X1 [Brachionus plicatilis]|uniref:A disintegrin and metallo ase with thrombospondin motifs 17 isoform X1 n=1 Tax=Brachionus plicatilis TaxID=10195 RepID=A0A3M7PX97_BRAPC|nr:A disintegrin and metallo ase with thrombospondin motifs 17 isoform X1 [Brachionus plicatilis]